MLKIMMVKLNGCIFWLNMITYGKNIILFGIKSALILKKKKGSDSKPVYHKHFLKSQIKSYGDEPSDFQDKQIPKVGSNYTWFTVISLVSAINKDENYYSQVFLKECNYIEKKVISHVDVDLRIFLILMSLMKNKLRWSKFLERKNVSYLSFKRKGMVYFLIYLYDFRSQNIGL